MEAAPDSLVSRCVNNLYSCVKELQARKIKIVSGTRIRDMVCGMLYMLKHGLICQKKIILHPIPEIDKYLPHENKIETYFGISSKVICMTENEIKYVFRDTA